jgi:hypothetical protein
MNPHGYSMDNERAGAGFEDNNPVASQGHHTPEEARLSSTPQGSGVATSGASLGAAVASAGALPGASSMSEESPSYRPASDTALGAARDNRYVSSTGVNLAPAAASGQMVGATTMPLNLPPFQGSDGRLGSLGATTVQDALLAAAPFAATGTGSPWMDGVMSQQRAGNQMVVARAEETAQANAGRVGVDADLTVPIMGAFLNASGASTGRPGTTERRSSLRNAAAAQTDPRNLVPPEAIRFHQLAEDGRIALLPPRPSTGVPAAQRGYCEQSMASQWGVHPSYGASTPHSAQPPTPILHSYGASTPHDARPPTLYPANHPQPRAGGNSGSFTEGAREAAMGSEAGAGARVEGGEQPTSYCENVARVCGAAQRCLQQTGSVVASSSQCIGDACQSVYGAVGTCGRCLLPSDAATSSVQQAALADMRLHITRQEQQMAQLRQGGAQTDRRMSLARACMVGCSTASSER